MSTRIATTKKLTYADYCRIPSDRNRHEVIDGEHWMSPAPDTYHQSLSASLTATLVDQLWRGRLGRVFAAPTDLQLSELDIVQPDLIVVLRDRYSIITPTKLEGVPHLVVEILSPSTAEIDRGRKLRLYQQSGIPEYWIVDPQQRTIEQWILRESGFELVGRQSERIVLLQLPQVAVDLSQVW